ncbi:MAG: TonB family protein [Chitinispirillaceae bacterium]
MSREKAGFGFGGDTERVWESEVYGDSSFIDADEEEEAPGRVLSDEEYSRVIREREDIFHLDKSRILRNVEIVSLLVAVGAGAFFSTRNIVDVAVDFYENLDEGRKIVVASAEEVQERINRKKEDQKAPLKQPRTERRSLEKNKNRGKGGNRGGGGDPRARVTKKGLLGIISGQIKGKTVASADLFAKGGFASDIDAVISGVGGLKKEGGGGVGRKGVSSIGYGAGYGAGFGEGSGIDNLLDGFMPGDAPVLTKKVSGRPIAELRADFETGGSLVGGRSRKSIMRVVMRNINSLRYAYNKRLREKPTLGGKITVKFAVDEFGKVIFAQAVQSSLNDSQLEQTVLRRVRSWVFDRIDKPGDVTEVVYPFVFSQ